MMIKRDRFPLYFKNKNGVIVKVNSDQDYTRYYTTLDGDDHKFTTESVEIKAGKAVDFFGLSWEKLTQKQFDAEIEKQFANKVHWVNSKPIQFAFMCQGTPYYTYANLWDMPIGRANEAEVVFMELDARMDVDYIEKAFTAIRDKTKGEKLDIGGIAIIAQDALHRRQMLVDWNIYEKAASVLYFDDAEDTSRYDFQYNEAKLKKWQDQGKGFFLSMPLAASIGLDKQSGDNFLANLTRDGVKRDLIIERLSQLSGNT